MVMVMGDFLRVRERRMGDGDELGDARFSRNILKFATCPYGCLITTLYGRSR